VAEEFKKSPARDTLESLIVTVILAVFGTTFVVQAFKIPTGSMEDTLLIGDHLLVNKMVFAHPRTALAPILPYREVRLGDIVVFKFPPTEGQTQPGEHFVKRVIGLPGDRIHIQHRQVYVNGAPVAEPFVRHSFPDQLRVGDDFPPPDSLYLRGATSTWTEEMPAYIQGGDLVVPPGRYFVMGDNREQSWDSRFWGFVPRQLISGRPLVIYWSYDTPRDEYARNSLGDKTAQLFDLVIHFIPKTRWRRTLSLVR